MIRSYIEKIALSIMDVPRRKPVALDTVLTDYAPVAMVYRITNGFISVVHSNDGRQPTITYCKDGEEISQAVVTQAVKEKLGVSAGLMAHAAGSTIRTY